MEDPLVVSGAYHPHLLDCGRVDARPTPLTIAPGSVDFDSSSYRLLRIIDGAADFVVQGQRQRQREGDVLLLQPGLRGSLTLAPGGRCLQACFDVVYQTRRNLPERRRARHRDDRLQPPAQVVWGLPLPEVISGAMAQAAALMLVRLASTYWRDALSHYLADAQLAMWLAELVTQVAGRDPTHLTSTRGDAVTGTVQLATQALSHRVLVDDLVRASGLGRSTFFRRFQSDAGCSPAGYVRHVRLTRACELLVDPAHGIAQIGRIVGYRNAAAFTRAFARRYGMPPSVWRRMHLHREA